MKRLQSPSISSVKEEELPLPHYTYVSLLTRNIQTPNLLSHVKITILALSITIVIVRSCLNLSIQNGLCESYSDSTCSKLEDSNIFQSISTSQRGTTC